MTATDELRHLLTERGVKYETYIEESTGFEHVKWDFNDPGHADFNLEFGEPWLTMYGVISGPEQAIAATLGAGTCHDLGGTGANDERVFNCSECGCVLSLYDRDGTNTLCTGFIFDYPRYCPACGAKVVDE